MNYSDGRKIKAGDKVELWLNCYGSVVCSIDDGVYTLNYPKKDWAYLKSGILVKMDNDELMHYSVEDYDLKYVESPNN
jgi:hypothetical protein